MAGEYNPNSILYNPCGGGGSMSNTSSGSAAGGGYEVIGSNYYNINKDGSSFSTSSSSSSSSQMIFSPAIATATANISISNSNSNNNLLLDSVPGLKHDTGLAVEWSVDEQFRLDQGLANYANEPTIMQYIKIAASLHDKTVRDVALRCRWMARKRRKQVEQSLGKKVKDRKDKLMESTLKNTMASPSSVHVPAFPLTTNHHGPSDYMFSGVLSCSSRHLLEENNQAFGQISANLSTFKLQENIDLFSRTRNNLTTILNDMGNMPGVMSQMPPLPVLLNEDLATSIFPHSPQPMLFGSSSTIPLKQEPRC